MYHKLTPLEKRIGRALLVVSSVSEIAGLLNRRPQSIRNYMHVMYEKLDLRNMLELYKYMQANPEEFKDVQ